MGGHGVTREYRSKNTHRCNTSRRSVVCFAYIILLYTPQILFVNRHRSYIIIIINNYTTYFRYLLFRYFYCYYNINYLLGLLCIFEKKTVPTKHLKYYMPPRRTHSSNLIVRLITIRPFDSSNQVTRVCYHTIMTKY